MKMGGKGKIKGDKYFCNYLICNQMKPNKTK